MKQNASALLSMIFLGIFLLLLVAMDIFIWPVSGIIAERSEILQMHFYRNRCLLTGTILTCSVPAYIAIFQLFRLLLNIRRGEVFVEQNVRFLRVTCWCLTAACAILAVSAIYYFLLLILAAACGFMAIIVHIVRNLIGTAVEMKSELDLTI